MNSIRKPSVVVDNGITPLNRATDPRQYDRQDLSWLREGGEARVIQYWFYLKERSRLWDGGRVLDVGCGDGWLLNNMLRSRAQTVVGIEPSAHNRELSKARYPKLVILPHSWETFPEDPNSYDLITAVLSLNHIDDIGEFFRKAHVMLSPGGHVMVVVPDFDYWRMPRRQYDIKVQEIDDDRYAAAVTRPSGVIADVVRRPQIYHAASGKAGFRLIEDADMPPAEAYLKLAPAYADAKGKAITRLLVFNKK